MTPIIPKILSVPGGVYGYDIYAALVTVPEGTVPAYENPPVDRGWFLYPADTPFTEALNAPAQYASGVDHPAGLFVAEFYSACNNPGPSMLPVGWLLANPLAPAPAAATPPA